METDLQDIGVDVDDPAVMTGRTWRWLRVRIAGLATSNSRTLRALRPVKRR